MPLPASVTLDSTPTLTLKLNVPSAFRPTTAQLVKSARPTSASALAAWIQSVLIQSPVKMVSAHHFLATMSLVEQMPNVPLPKRNGTFTYSVPSAGLPWGDRRAM